MKNKSLVFSIVFSLFSIALLFTINYVTSFAHPWFIYPAFAVLWWPLSLYFGKTKKFRAFSVIGALYIAGFSYLVNLITSTSFPWFMFPAFAVMWWPLSVLLAKKPKAFAVVSALYISAFFAILNYTTSPGFPWAIFPIFAVMWWPLTVLINPAKRAKIYSIVGGIYILGFMWIVNYITTPSVIWFFYPAFAVLWWPISLVICGAKKYKLYSVVSTIYITAFLALVNYITSPQYIWFYYPLYALLWWPLSMFLARKPKIYSVVMSLLTLGFLALINYMNSPNTIWFLYVGFNLIWWPLAMLLGKHAKSFWFALIGAASIIGYYIFLYYRLTPGIHPWYLYIILPAIWWSVCAALKKRALTIVFQIISVVVFLAYYIILNAILTPTVFWTIHLIYPALWALMGIYFGHTKKYFAFSICAAVVTIAYFAFINYMYSPNVIWAVYPAFAILWWPLSMYFFKSKKETPQKVSQ
ncbi:MAG: hypothetical protein AB1Z23_06510 [Eubacteriales bacterium]